MLRTASLSLALVVALGCGGGGKKSDTTMTGDDPGTGTTEPTDPGTEEPPADPVEPEEPAQPEEPPAPDPEAVKAELRAAEEAAWTAAKPVFDKGCAHCHAKGGKKANAKKLGEFDMTAYPFTGEHHTAAEVREVLGIGGGKATMPMDKPGSIKGADLDLIAAWADAWDAAETGGAH